MPKKNSFLNPQLPIKQRMRHYRHYNPFQRYRKHCLSTYSPLILFSCREKSLASSSNLSCALLEVELAGPPRQGAVLPSTKMTRVSLMLSWIDQLSQSKKLPNNGS